MFATCQGSCCSMRPSIAATAAEGTHDQSHVSGLLPYDSYCRDRATPLTLYAAASRAAPKVPLTVRPAPRFSPALMPLRHISNCSNMPEVNAKMTQAAGVDPT